MTNDDKNQPDTRDRQADMKRLWPTGEFVEPEKSVKEQKDKIRTSPLWRQIVVIGVIAIALVIAVAVIKSRSKSPDNGAAAANALNPNQVLVEKAAAEAVELRTAPVTLEAGKRSIHTNGVVHFSPYSTINVSPRLVGRVSVVYVKVGEHVSIGQPLMEMVSSDAANAVDAAHDADEQLKLTAYSRDVARQQFKLGTPEVTSAQAALDQAHESTLFNKRELDLTREQNTIGGFTDKPLSDAQSAVKQAETQLAQDLKDETLAQRVYDRTSKLFAIGVTAKQDVDNAEDALGKAKDAVENDREQLRIAHVTLDREQKAYNTRLYANQTVRQAETNYEQAEIQERAATVALRMAKAALNRDLKQAEHDYAVAATDARAAHSVVSHYDNPTPSGLIVVRAPAMGVVTARNVNPGQIVDQTGQTPWQMFTIVNANRVYVDAQVYEKDMIGVHIGEPVTATSDALPARFVAAGTISYVAPGLDPASHALSVRADLDNSLGLLKDGMFVSSTIDVSAHSPFAPTPIVPLTAVVHDGDSDYVFVEVSAGKYDRRKVTLGEQRGEGLVAITHGLNGSETIVTHGALYLGTGGTAQD
jgi:RND family efflux transporter MFP subunit